MPRWQSHHDALIAEWKRDHDGDAARSAISAPPLPSARSTAFMRLVDAGWDTEAAAAPTGSAPPSWCTSTSRSRIAALHLGRCCPTPTADT